MKSSGKFWKEVGYVLKFEVNLNAVGRNRGIYATYFTVYNLTNQTKYVQSSNQMTIPLSNLNLRQLP